jgi:lysozyme family protein
MMENFQVILAKLLEIEGGFVDNPEDSGGMTNLGVTARMWASWLNVPLTRITKQTMLGLKQQDVSPFYIANYWNLVNGNDLPSGVDAMVFHFEVDAGGVSAKILQQVVGVQVDGIVGPATILATKGYLANYGKVYLFDALANRQIAYYKSLANFGTFGQGWIDRVNAFQDLAESLAPG